jgi:hypothetical protein
VATPDAMPQHAASSKRMEGDVVRVMAGASGNVGGSSGAWLGKLTMPKNWPQVYSDPVG